MPALLTSIERHRPIGTIPIPPGAYTTVKYFNDFTTSASMNDWRVSQTGSGDFGNNLGTVIAGGPLTCQLDGANVVWDGASAMRIITAETTPTSGVYNVGMASTVNTARTTPNTSSLAPYVGQSLGFTFGTWLARIQTPYAPAMWNGFYMLPTNAGFTAGQEMDFAEWLPGMPGMSSAVACTPHGVSGPDPGSTYTTVNYSSGQYNIYGGSIDPAGNATWWVNGVNVKSTTAGGANWTGRTWFMILGTGTGGWNQSTPVPSDFPNNFLIDWVGVWQ